MKVERSMLNVERSGCPAALRELLAQRFPSAARRADEALATGISTVDAVGGLPRPGLTELVGSAPSCGSQLFLGQLLHTTRAQGLRVALVDRGDAFDPNSWPAPVLEHLVWVRAKQATEALQAADLLSRDANLGLVILDLRHTPLAELRRIPSPSWYRLQRALEPTLLAGVILTPFSLVPSVRLRLELSQSHALAAQSRPRPELVTRLAPELIRQRAYTAATG
jgi:hypothetical protein